MHVPHELSAARPHMDDAGHTLVLDIGKTHAKLVLIDTHGEVLARQVQANAPVQGPHYLELGVDALEHWLLQAIATLPQRERIAHISISTHGAAFCATDGERLVLPPIDYEWDGYGPHRERFVQLADGFDCTGSPPLPQGLNAGLQLYWLQQTQAAAWSRIRHWLPYPQYWAWWFSGVATAEVSSLGCHTHLWQPRLGRPAPWTQAAGIAERLPPLRPAWAVAGRLRPALAAQLQLPPDCQVHVGVHDSNACLARHLQAAAGATVVSTGTWCVVMAPGAEGAALAPERDELVNVSVEGLAIPTARFMAGREFALLCHGTDPALATLAALDAVLAQGWAATPSFAQAGPYRERPGRLWQGQQMLAAGIEAVPPPLRPALAALYCAQMTSELVLSLTRGGSGTAPVVIEGPLAGNEVFAAALATWLPGRTVMRTADTLEGTARGAWMLADWPARSRRSGGYLSCAAPDEGLRQKLAHYRARR